MFVVLDLIIQFFFFSLSWAPGVIIFEIFLKNKVDSQLGRFIFGSASWMLVLVAPSLFIGHVLNIRGGITCYFSFLAFLGSAIYVFYLFRFVHSLLLNGHESKNLRVSKRYIPYAVIIALITVYIVIATYFTHILWQWDAISIYLPAASSVAETGFFGESLLLGSSIENLQPPFAILLYSWNLHFGASFFLRAIPLMFLFLTTISIYRIATTLWSKYVGITAILSFITFFGLHFYMSRSSLYLDMALTFTLAASLLAVINAVKGSRNIIFTLAPIALMAIAKETGIFYTFFFIVALVPRWPTTKAARVLKSLMLVSPFFLFTIMDASSPFFSGFSLVGDLFITRIVLIFIFFLFFMCIPSGIHLKTKISHTLTHIFLIASAAVLFFIPNFYRFGVLTSNFAPSLAREITAYNVSFASLSVVQPLSVLEFYRFFLSILFTPVIIPLLVGLLFFVYAALFKKNRSTNLILSLLLFGLLSWSFLSYSRLDGGYHRHLLPFAAISSLLVAYGVSEIGKCLQISRFQIPLVFAAVVSINQFYVWSLAPTTFDWVHKLSYLMNNRFAASLVDIGICSLPWLIIFSLKYVWHVPHPNLKSVFNFLKDRQIKAFAFILLFGIVLILPVQLLSSTVPVILNKSANPVLYENPETIEELYGDHYLTDVIQFYTDNPDIHNNLTITFAAWPISYFSGARIIDLARAPSLIKIIPLISNSNITAVADNLLNKGYTQLLLPKSNHQHFSRYEKLFNASPFLESLPYNNITSSFSRYVIMSKHVFERYELYSFIETDNGMLTLPIENPGNYVSVGNWTQQNDNLLIMTKGSRLDFANNLLSNGTITLQMMHTKNESISNIFFRAQSITLDRRNLYWARLDSRERYCGFHLFKNVDGQETLLASYSIPVGDNIWYNIKLEFDGNTLKGYLNNEIAWNVVDSDFSSGYCGLDVESVSEGNVNIYLDSFSINFSSD